jgi:undecaprenyl-diphosphatase
MNRNTAKPAYFLALIHQLDVMLFYWTMNRHHLELLAKISRKVSHSADGFAYPFMALLLYVYDTAHGAVFAQAMLLAFALERPLYWVLKNGLKRNRPSAILPNYESFIIPSDQFSFPSGHTSGAFVTASLLMVFYPPVAAIAYIWAVTVAISRVTLGVHFPTDTLAGAVMGSSIALGSAYWVSGGF